MNKSAPSLALSFLVSIFIFICYSSINLGVTYDSLNVKKDLSWGDINFVHTTDTHGWYAGHTNQMVYNADWGDFVSFVTHLRKIADQAERDILIVDSGDRHDGNGLSDASFPNGALSLPIFIKQSYDILTIGNHELYLLQNTKEEIDIVVEHFKDNYVCTNVEIEAADGSYLPIGNRFKYFITPKQNIRVLALSFLFDFDRNALGTRVTPIADLIDQSWFHNIIHDHPSDDVDLIVLVGHLPVTHEWTEAAVLHKFLRKHYPHTKIQYFGGHSHIRDFAIYDDNSTALQSGRFCETVGWLSINMNIDLNVEEASRLREVYSRSYIDFSIESFMYHTGVGSKSKFQTRKGSYIKEMISEAKDRLNLTDVIGHVGSNYFMNNVPLDHRKNIYNLLTSRVLPTLVPENIAMAHNENRIIIINTGSIRYDLYKGPYTKNDEYVISPFRNEWVKLSVPKKYAIGISRILNKADYIVKGSQGSDMYSELAPPHVISMMQKRNIQSESDSKSFLQTPFETGLSGSLLSLAEHKSSKKLTRGYITQDDFGNDGDDTKHRGMRFFPIPNVVESVALKNEVGDDELVDVIFYSFITRNIVGALSELGHNTSQSQVESYSNVYLGKLLNDFIKINML